MLADLKDMTKSRDGKWIISFTTYEDFSEMFDELAGKPVMVEIKKASRHRSLSANAYAWVLIDQITARLQDMDKDGYWTPEKVYLKAIENIGGISDLYGVKESAFESFKELWCKGHIGRRVTIIPGSTKPGWINVMASKGSSDFDTVQMSRLIDSLIQEAESLGIPTITEEQAEKMMGRWGK